MSSPYQQDSVIPLSHLVWIGAVFVLLLALWALWPMLPAAAQGCSTAVDVSSSADSGAGTLRQALLDLCPGATIPGTITFDGLTAAGPATITLASTLHITQSLLLDGPGAALLTVSGNGTVGVFQVNAGVTAVLDGLTISDGRSSTYGGGIKNAGTLTLLDSQLSGNSAGSASGGGIYNSGKLTVKGSTFVANRANNGGAIYNNAGSLLIANSTFFGNSATNGSGGAIDNAAAVTAVNVTFSGNSAIGYGGGINSPAGSVTLTNTIVANNTYGWGGHDIDAFPGVVTTANVLTGNLPLGPLRDNGGPTWTMALPGGSPAIDAANDTACAGAPVSGVDQRGVVRPQGASCDIGAFEFVLTTIVVQNTNDDGPGSLREALAAPPGGSIIRFDPALTASGPATITLASTLQVTQSTTISGPGADLLALSGSNTVGVVQVNAGVTAVFSGLSFSGGSSSTRGGGINNAGKLVLFDSSVSGNAAPAAFGGGIFNNGNLTIKGSTLAGNSAADGGAIYNYAGSVLIANSTFFGNAAASGSGGAIDNLAEVAAINVTLSGNSAAAGGGGIHSPSGTVALTNTLVANNTAGSGNGDIAAGAGVLQMTNVLSGSVALGPLQDNGGPTWTMALPPTSPAVDAGDNGACAAAPVSGLDQRGVLRPQGANCDIGAYELVEIVLSNTNDSGTGSLRETLAAAPDGAAIVFDPAITGGGAATITLASTLELSRNVSIVGPGASLNTRGQLGSALEASSSANLLTISGNRTVRVFSVGPGATVNLVGLNIANGTAVEGGAIYVDGGHLTVQNTTIAGNTALKYGGAIYNPAGGSVNLSNSVLFNNRAGDSNKAGGSVNGGAVMNLGSLQVLSSTFSTNSVSSPDESGEAGGGAIYNGSTMTVTNSTFWGNVSYPGYGAYGGAIDNGIGASALISGTTFDSNVAYAGFPQDGLGGGLYNAGMATVVNSSFVNSAAQKNGGGLDNAAALAAAYAGADLWLTHVTLAGHPDNDPATAIVRNGAGGTLHIHNTIVAHGTCINDGIMAANIHNLVEDGSCSENGVNLRSGPARLGPPQDNGGPTLTMALPPDSPAVDAGSREFCTPTDQRGMPRRQETGCDIGAYEAGLEYTFLPAITR